MDYIRILKEEREKVKKLVKDTPLGHELLGLDESEDTVASSSSKRPITNEQDYIFSISHLLLADFTASLSTWSIDLSLDEYCVANNAYYIANFLPEHIAMCLLDLIDIVGNQGGWISLKSRQLQHWGNKPQQPGNDFIPDWLTELIRKLHELKLFPDDMKPNNVLINQYESHQGIVHHTDGPLYRDYVLIFSLESDCIMTFKPNLKASEIGIKPSDDLFSVVLEARSLFCFSSDNYTHMMHGIYDHEYVGIVGERANCLNVAQSTYKLGDQVCSKSNRKMF